MAKKDKKPVKVNIKEAKASKAPKKTEKPTVKAAAKSKAPAPAAKKAVKATPALKVKASPKTVEVDKKKASASVPVAAPKKEAKAKKAKKGMDEDDHMFDGGEDDFEDIDTTGFDDFKGKSPEELEEIRKLLGDAAGSDDEVEIALRDAEGRLYCRIRDCDELSTVDGFCRYHYIKMWKRIQLRKKILTDGKLEKYIEELTQRYPDKYIEMIRDDLKSEKKFLEAIQELEIEDVNEDTEMDDDQALIDEVRGITPTGETDDDSF